MDVEVSIPNKNSRNRTERVFRRKLPMEMSQREKTEISRLKGSNKR